MNNKPIPYGKHLIDENDIEAVIEVLKSENLTQGPKVNEFESRFANYVGSKYAISVSNGTAALHLSALCLDLKKGQKVITTPLSFVATANCIEYCGAEVEFCDIDPKTLCLDIKQLRNKLESSPEGTYAGLIPVNFAGYPLKMDEFKILADQYNLWIIEDSCHSPGGFYFDSKKQVQNCGNCNYSDLAIFSFHPVKHIACGEGGMITTNNKFLYSKLLEMRSHGITKNPEKLVQNHGNWYYEMQNLGFNYRLPDILCALGITQLKKAEFNLNRRKEIASKYIRALKELPLVIPESFFHKGNAFHLFIILTKKRKELYDFLNKKNIRVQIHYLPIHKMPYYKNKYGDLKLQNSELYYQNCLSLPMYPSLQDKEQDMVIEYLKVFFGEKK